MAKIQRIDSSKDQEIPCCAYVRVSTMKEEQESSFLMQDSYWTEKLQTLSNRKFCGVFADQGISGHKVIQRKEYVKMIELAMAGFIKEIYTKSIYRFGRNSKETMDVIKTLREKGVAIIFDEENINTLTCSMDLLMNLKAILGEQELRTMSKNVQFTARNNFKKGIVPKTQIFGYDFNEENQMVINKEEAKIVRLIFTLYLKGYGIEGIANQLTKLKIPTCTGKEVWRNTTVQRILRNEKYIGDALLQKEFYDNGRKQKNKGQLEQYYITNNHEAIIDRETFNSVNKIMLERTRKATGNKMQEKRRYSLSGKIKCGKCGNTFRHRINKRIVNCDNRQWICINKERHGKCACSAIDIPQDLLNEIIFDAYNEYVDIPYELPNNNELKQKIREIQNIIDKIKRLYIDKLITYGQYKLEVDKKTKEQSELIEKLRNYNLLSVYKKPKCKAKEFTDEIVEKHIEKIIITDYKIDIIFKNQQCIKKEYKYEHRKYCKNY